MLIRARANVRTAIVEAIEKLPSEVATWVDGNVEFESFGHGMAIPPGTSKRWTVLVSVPSPDVILHECAHAYLAHAGACIEYEREAAAQAHEWGGEGAACNPFTAEAGFRRIDLELFSAEITGEVVVFTCDTCAVPAEVEAVPGLTHSVRLLCPMCLQRDVVRLLFVKGLRCGSCGVDPATSNVVHRPPPWWWRDPIGWIQRGAPGLRPWARRWFPPEFRVEFVNGEVRVRCGSCRGRSRLRITNGRTR